MRKVKICETVKDPSFYSLEFKKKRPKYLDHVLEKSVSLAYTFGNMKAVLFKAVKKNWTDGRFVIIKR